MPGPAPAVQRDTEPEKTNPGARNGHSGRFVFRAPLPPPGVHQNARFVNPAARNTTIQAYVSDVSATLRESAGPPPYPRFERAVISLEFIVPDRIHRDVLNYAAAFKPGIDLLCDFRHGRKLKLPGLGIIPDDDSSHLQVGFIKMRVTRPDEDAGVIVTLEPGEGDEGRLFS